MSGLWLRLAWTLSWEYSPLFTCSDLCHTSTHRLIENGSSRSDRRIVNRNIHNVQNWFERVEHVFVVLLKCHNNNIYERMGGVTRLQSEHKVRPVAGVTQQTRFCFLLLKQAQCFMLLFSHVISSFYAIIISIAPVQYLESLLFVKGVICRLGNKRLSHLITPISGWKHTGESFKEVLLV